jgi:hypothetical protein
MLADQAEQLQCAVSFARSAGACITAYPSPDILRVAASTSNEKYGHLLALEVKRTIKKLDTGASDCAIESQPELDVSRMRAQSKTSDGIVYFVRIAGRPFALKWASSNGPNRPFADDAAAVVENVVSCGVSAARIVGRMPFFTATYCTFGCRISKNAITRAQKSQMETFFPLSRSLVSPVSSRSSWIGMASIQEFVPFDLKRALSMCGMDVVKHAALVTMMVAAIYFANEVIMVNHNDLHLANIRFAPAPDGRVSLRWNGRWRAISSPLYPMIIDWGRACEYVADGVCSDDSKFFFKREGRPVSKSADLLSIVSRMVIPIPEQWMPGVEKNPEGLSIFSNALRILAGSRVPQGGASAQEVAAAMCLVNLFICCSTEFSADGSPLQTPNSLFETTGPHVVLETDAYLTYVLSGTQADDRRPFRMAQSRLFMDTFVKLWPETKPPRPGALCAVVS